MMSDERLISGITNKKLSLILVVLIIVTLIGTFYNVFESKITGFATSGTVEVRIQAFSSINVNNNVYFGNGTISNNPLNLTSINTENANPSSFNNCSAINGGAGVADAGRDCSGLEIENNGNVYVNVSMTASKAIATFFDSNGDVGADFRFAVLDGNRTKLETTSTIVGYGNSGTGVGNASCLVNVNNNYQIRPSGSYVTASGFKNWTVIPTTEYLICGNLSFGDQNDTVTVEFNLTFPPDEPVGLKTNTFTFTAVQV